MFKQYKKVLIIFFIATILFLNGSSSSFALSAIQEQLTRIENEVWGFSYDNESDLERTQRLEKQIFGKAETTTDIQKRIDKLTKTLGIETLQEAKSSLSDLYVGEKAGPNVEYPQIDMLENQLLGSVYKTDNINTRLERLEKKVFGAKQEGDLSIRTDNLKRHAINSVAGSSSVNTVPRSSYGGYQANRQMYDDEIKFQLTALENAIFSSDFSQEPVPLRLVRLENKIFQRDFRDDDIQTRISRIQAAATAGKTAKYYDGNKFQKFASTGIQAASFLLMILAFIL